MHRIVTVTQAVRETPKITTLRFVDKACSGAAAGQFVMVWVPGVDEIPMSLSYVGDSCGITVNNVGEATASVCSLKKGERLGIRGPFGNGFVFSPGGKKPKSVLAVGGGVGMAPLAPAIEVARAAGLKVTTVIGARTAKEVLFEERAAKSSEVITCTDDGSKGRHGFCTDAVQKLLEKRGAFGLVITCGPEVMMEKVAGMAAEARVPVQASVERYMKCGIGLCDACAIGGLLVCRDGPVLSGAQLNGTDFGSCCRDSCGRQVSLKPGSAVK